eukprot:GSChrysophyteH1.ASY1.ANO1.1381.1 assembled CDS
MTERVYIGVDIGGSHISVALVETVVEMIKQPLNTQNEISRAHRNLCGVGIGCPGQSKNGVLVAASNFPLLKNAPLVDMLHGYSFLADTPVVLLNDADAAVSAELWAADSRDYYTSVQNAAMITLGTGIGLGLVLNGRLFQGGFGCVEGGHMIVDSSADATACGCGQRGCAEVYASASNISRIYCERLKSSGGADDEQKESPDLGGSKRVFAVADAQSDSVAAAVLDDACKKIATMCINLCRVVDPSVIILGGGMSQAGDALLRRVQRHVDALTWTVLPTDVKVVIAKGMANAGTIGAALASRNLSSSSRSLLTTGGPSPHTSREWSGVVPYVACFLFATAGYAVATMRSRPSARP